MLSEEFSAASTKILVVLFDVSVCTVYCVKLFRGRIRSSTDLDCGVLFSKPSNVTFCDVANSLTRNRSSTWLSAPMNAASSGSSLCSIIYRVSQEECAILREGVP